MMASLEASERRSCTRTGRQGLPCSICWSRRWAMRSLMSAWVEPGRGHARGLRDAQVGLDLLVHLHLARPALLSRRDQDLLRADQLLLVLRQEARIGAVEAAGQAGVGMRALFLGHGQGAGAGAPFPRQPKRSIPIQRATRATS